MWIIHLRYKSIALWIRIYRKIYRIVCNITGKQYIGSTTAPLSKRLTGHKSNYNKYINGRYHYVTSFEIIKNNDYAIILIENANCNNKEELLRRERHYIESMSCVNKTIPLRTFNEYVKANIEKRQKAIKKYSDTHKDKRQQYYVDNKERISIKQKLYYEQNRDSFLNRSKVHYQKNVKNIKNPILCECGCTLKNKGSKSKHQKSKKHLAYLDSLKEEN